MPRKLKTYQTSLGFFDQAIAAPSMKAALEAWGADSNLFHQGVATETDDPEIVAATMAKPGVVLRRPVGSDGPFKESAELPTDLAGHDARRPGKVRAKSRPKKHPPRKSDDKTDRKAALAFEREQARRDRERRKEEAAREKERERREKVVAKAQAALDKARREHEGKVSALEAERAALDERAEAEETRWEKQKAKLDGALRRARE
jgi:colicin import membrane protein